jgi:hypothetical protein
MMVDSRALQQIRWRSWCLISWLSSRFAASSLNKLITMKLSLQRAHWHNGGNLPDHRVAHADPPVSIPPSN